MAGKAAVSTGLSAQQDDRLLKTIRDVLYDTVLNHTDWETVLSILVKSGFINEKRQKVLEKKTQGDAAVAFLALLKKSQPIRWGFLLALKESASSLPNHNMLLSSLTKAAGVDVKSLEEEHAVAKVAAGMSTVCVCV